MSIGLSPFARHHAFRVSLLSPDWNFIPDPAMQLCIVAASTCFVKKSANRDLYSSDHRLCPEEYCVDVLHLKKPSPAPNRNSSCGVHPHMSIELPSPVQENTVQAKHLRCRTHLPIMFRLARAECNHCLSLAVRADSTATQHQRTWSVSHQARFA